MRGELVAIILLGALGRASADRPRPPDRAYFVKAKIVDAAPLPFGPGETLVMVALDVVGPDPAPAPAPTQPWRRYEVQPFDPKGCTRLYFGHHAKRPEDVAALTSKVGTTVDGIAVIGPSGGRCPTQYIDVPALFGIAIERTETVTSNDGRRLRNDVIPLAKAALAFFHGTDPMRLADAVNEVPTVEAFAFGLESDLLFVPGDSHIHPTEWTGFPNSFELARTAFVRTHHPERLELMWNISVDKTLAQIEKDLATAPAMLLEAAKTLRDPRFYDLVLAKLSALATSDRMLAIQVLAGSIVDAEAPDEYLEPMLKGFTDLDKLTRWRVDEALATFEKRRKLGYADLTALWTLAQATKKTYDSKWRAIVGQRFRITGTLDGRGYLPLRTHVGPGQDLETDFGLDTEGYALLDKLGGPDRLLTADGVFDEISTSVVEPRVRLRHVRLSAATAPYQPPAPTTTPTTPATPPVTPTPTAPARGCRCDAGSDPDIGSFVLLALALLTTRSSRAPRRSPSSSRAAGAAGSPAGS